MNTEPSLCIICAWKKDCQKKFLRSKDATLRCPDFTKDVSIKDREKLDDQKKDSGDNR
ncbi:MAG: hypothetical protein NTU90_01240 [Proteobacteria bacterium]|jgi:hypothetical protein|nr:hypothetical protein [Pseudomonadota bacterium]